MVSEVKCYWHDKGRQSKRLCGQFLMRQGERRDGDTHCERHECFPFHLYKPKTLHHPICLWKSHLGPLCVQCILRLASPCRRHAPVLLGKTKGLCTMSWVVSQPFLLEPLGRTHGPIFQHQSCGGDTDTQSQKEWICVCVCWSGFYHWEALWIVEGNGGSWLPGSSSSSNQPRWKSPGKNTNNIQYNQPAKKVFIFRPVYSLPTVIRIFYFKIALNLKQFC